MERTERFAEVLYKLDRQACAELRRSLSFQPGTYPRAYPYVEPFINRTTDRHWFYLVAGLFALSQQGSAPGVLPSNGGTDRGMSLGKAAARLYAERESSPSIEHRFIALLDADSEQLPHRLRQMVSLLRAEELALDWGRLLDDLLGWEHEQRYVQQRWAREFYRASQPTGIGPGAQRGSEE